ncbi:MAG: P-II family nitrogen regulator [Myxococcota bacterium]
MKILRIHVRPFAFEEVVGSLEAEGFAGMTLSEVHAPFGGGAQAGRYRGAPLWRPGVMKIEIMLALHDDRVERAIRALARCTSDPDLSVTVQPLERALRIRTGEIDEAAL